MADADRIRLLARTPADYVGYGYAPLLADDVSAMARVLADTADEATDAASSSAAAAASAALADLDRISAAASANSAAAAVPATADRTIGRRLNDTAIWSMIRATPAWGFGPTGVLAETAIDTIRWEFNPTTLAPFGIAFAGARANLLTNPRFEGGTVGVIGSGGVLPSNMSIGTALGGIVYTVVAFGTLSDGQPYLDMRYAGTSTAAGVCRLLISTPSGTVFAASEVITAVTGIQLIAGSFAGFSSSAHRFTGISPASGPAISNPTSTLVRTSRQQTCTGNTTGSTAGWEYLWSVPISTAIDATIRYVLPQLQRGAFVSSPILPTIGTPAISTRAQGSVTISVSQLGTRWNRRQGILIVDWNSQPGAFTSAADADWFGLISWGDQTANERLGILINPSHTSVEARVTAGGAPGTASVATITAPTAGLTTRAAVAWDLDAGFLQVAARGTSGTKVSLSALPIPGFIMMGRYGTTHPLFGRLNGAEIRPAALFDASLAALT